jgi:hypothetical protein
LAPSQTRAEWYGHLIKISKFAKTTTIWLKFKGERKGTNKYYPPDFDPKIHKSLNGYHGTHALRERARKLDRGILIIRFEMPYNIWCDGCKSHVAMGVRYNAEKTKVGMYFTTPIYQFRMKCHLCDNHYEIRTDPQVSLDAVVLLEIKQNLDFEEPRVCHSERSQAQGAEMEHGRKRTNRNRRYINGFQIFVRA